MHQKLWGVVFLSILSLPNIIALWFDPSATKFAAFLIPILFFIGLIRLFTLSKRALLLVFVPFFILSYMDMVYLLQYNVQTTAGMIGHIFSSDIREGLEFANEVPRSTFYILLVYMLIFLYLYFLSRNQVNKHHSYSKIITSLLIVLPVVDSVGKGASARSFPLGIARAAHIYTRDTIVANKLIKQREGFSFGASTSDKESPENYIFVIGETARRDYQSLYGYSRNTNPLLSKLSGLVLFSDVAAPANATIPSLKYMLYMATVGDDSLFYSSNSIVSLAKEAGYRTYWLSAQARYGEFDATTGSTGVEANKKVFISAERAILHTYDGELVNYLKEGVEEEAPKKFIVMHFYGSHLAYDKRYPEKFNSFKGVPPGYEGRSEEIQEKVRAYSNSITYTDYVLSQIIKTVAKQKKPSCVIYTSDHGEYLADKLNDNYTGHGYPTPHKVEIDVPLMVWCSQEFRDSRPAKWANILKNKDLKISNEDMFYSLADLMQINFSLFKPERSFFSSHYKPVKERKIISASDKKLFNYSELK